MGKTYKGEVLIVPDGLGADVLRNGTGPIKAGDIVHLTGFKFNFVRLLKIDFVEKVIYRDRRYGPVNANKYKIEFKHVDATGNTCHAARTYGSLKFRDENYAYEGF